MVIDRFRLQFATAVKLIPSIIATNCKTVRSIKLSDHARVAQFGLGGDGFGQPAAPSGTDASSAAAAAATAPTPDAWTICSSDEFLDALVAALRRLRPTDAKPLFELPCRSTIDLDVTIQQHFNNTVLPHVEPFELLARKFSDATPLAIRANFNVGPQHRVYSPEELSFFVPPMARALVDCRNRINSTHQLSVLKLFEA